MLPDMLGGAKPIVVANAVVPLCGISAGARRNYLKLGETTVSKLLPALYEGMEWEQVFILGALTMYGPPMTFMDRDRTQRWFGRCARR